MTSHIHSIRAAAPARTAPAYSPGPGTRRPPWTGFLVPLGRLLFSLIFLASILGHFSPGTVAFAAQGGVPAASLLVPLSGVIASAGAVSIILGFQARLGAWLIILF